MITFVRIFRIAALMLIVAAFFVSGFPLTGVSAQVTNSPDILTSPYEVCLDQTLVYIYFGGSETDWERIDINGDGQYILADDGCGYNLVATGPVDLTLQPGVHLLHDGPTYEEPIQLPGWTGPASAWVQYVQPVPEYLPETLRACVNSPSEHFGAEDSDWNPEAGVCGWAWGDPTVPHTLVIQEGARFEYGVGQYYDGPMILPGWTGNGTLYQVNVQDPPELFDRDVKSCFPVEDAYLYLGAQPDDWGRIDAEGCGYELLDTINPKNLSVQRNFLMINSGGYQVPAPQHQLGYEGPASFWLLSWVPVPEMLPQPMTSCTDQPWVYFGGETADWEINPDPNVCSFTLLYPEIPKDLMVQPGSVFEYSGGIIDTPGAQLGWTGDLTVYVGFIEPSPELLDGPILGCPAETDVHLFIGGQSQDWQRINQPGCGFTWLNVNVPTNLTVQPSTKFVYSETGWYDTPQYLYGWTGPASIWFEQTTPFIPFYPDTLHACPITYPNQVFGGQVHDWERIDGNGDGTIDDSDGCGWRRVTDMPVNVTVHDGATFWFGDSPVEGPATVEGQIGTADMWVNDIWWPVDYTEVIECPVQPHLVMGGISGDWERIVDGQNNPIGCGFTRNIWENPRNITIQSNAVFDVGTIGNLGVIEGPLQIYFWNYPGAYWFLLTPPADPPEVLDAPLTPDSAINPAEMFGGNPEDWELISEPLSKLTGSMETSSASMLRYRKVQSSPVHLTVQPGIRLEVNGQLFTEPGHLNYVSQEVVVTVVGEMKYFISLPMIQK